MEFSSQAVAHLPLILRAAGTALYPPRRCTLRGRTCCIPAPLPRTAIAVPFSLCLCGRAHLPDTFARVDKSFPRVDPATLRSQVPPRSDSPLQTEQLQLLSGMSRGAESDP